MAFDWTGRADSGYRLRFGFCRLCGGVNLAHHRITPECWWSCPPRRQRAARRGNVDSAHSDNAGVTQNVDCSRMARIHNTLPHTPVATFNSPGVGDEECGHRDGTAGPSTATAAGRKRPGNLQCHRIAQVRNDSLAPATIDKFTGIPDLTISAFERFNTFASLRSDQAMLALRKRLQRVFEWRGRKSLARRLGWALSLFVILPLVGQNADAEELTRTATDPDDQISSGIVLGHDGKPAANVEVWLTKRDWRISSGEEHDSTRTNGAGRFQVKIPGRWFQLFPGFRQGLSFVARSADGGLAILAFNPISRIPTEHIELKLTNPSQTTIRVISPDNQPVAGARVEIESAGGPQVTTDVSDEQALQFPNASRTPNGLVMSHTTIELPASVRKRFTGTTADDGSVVIKEIAPDQVRSVRVTTAKYGAQISTYVQHQPPRPEAGWPAEIKLAATGTLRGKLAADNPEWIKGRRLVISSADPVTQATDVVKTIGEADVTTDADGRFEIAALAPGLVSFRNLIDEKSRSCVSAPRDLTLTSGEMRVVELRVVPAVRVRGLVQDADDDKPIADLGISVFAEVPSIRTDKQGAYELDLAAGGNFVIPLLPESLIPITEEHRGLTIFTIPEGVAEFQAPAIKLRRAATIRGTVVDDARKPVAGATVASSWFGYSRLTAESGPQEGTATTNERGEFILSGVDLRSGLLLQARTATACTAEATLLRSVPAEAVSLCISPDNMARLTGRVIDSSGKPVADLPLELWARNGLAVDRGYADDGVQRSWQTTGPARRIELPEKQLLVTDSRGEFATPPIEPDLQYRVELRTRGYRETSSDWATPAAGKTVEIAELTVCRVTEDRGLVQDSNGRPIAGALVTFSEAAGRVETTTDENGAFRLDDVTDGGAFLFVRKAGWRFHGERYVAKGGVVEVILEGPDEVPSATFSIVQKQSALADRRARAVKLLEQTLEAKEDNQNRQDQNRMRTLQAWARVDPPAALAKLDAKPFKNPMFGDMIRHAAMQTVAVRDVDAALEIIETMSPGYGRAQSLVEVGDRLPPGERQRKLDLVADALVIFRTIKEPEMRLGGISMIAERLLDLGEQDRGEKLFRDELETARQLGTAAFAGFARGVFAEKFGVVDLPAALDLMKGLQDEREFNRHHGNLAHELAGKTPADAEIVLDLIKPPKDQQFSNRDSYAVRICYRMAPVDLPRAERIALSIVDLSQRGLALGVMAEALAAKDLERAREVLRRAYDVLDDADRDWKHGIGPEHPAVIAGCLLSTARKLDFDPPKLPLLKECIWRTVALVPSATTDPNKSWYAVEAGSSVALWLAEFDAPLAREVLLRVNARQDNSSRTYVPALAVVAGDRLDAYLEGMPEDFRDSSRMSAAAILPLDGAELRRQIHHITGVWPIDVEDVVW